MNLKSITDSFNLFKLWEIRTFKTNNQIYYLQQLWDILNISYQQSFFLLYINYINGSKKKCQNSGGGVQSF